MSVEKRMKSEILLNMNEWYVAFKNQKKIQFYKLSQVQIQKNDNKERNELNEKLNKYKTNKLSPKTQFEDNVKTIFLFGWQG